MIYELKNEFLTVKVDSLGAELISAVGADGHEYVWPAEPGCWESHAPILFPACGRLLNSQYTYRGTTYNMNAHGFASKSEFKALRATSSALTLMLKSNESTKEIYPFDFTFTAEYTLVGNALSLALTVRNDSRDLLPYMVGWHPGFVLEGEEPIGDFTLKMDAKNNSVVWYPLQNGCFIRPYGEDYQLTNGSYPLTEEEIYKNDTMIFVGTGNSARLSSPGSTHTVNMTWSDNLPYFCIWKDDFSAARFICLEPWSDVPGTGDVEENFDTRKMSRLAPDAFETYTYRVVLA